MGSNWKRRVVAVAVAAVAAATSVVMTPPSASAWTGTRPTAPCAYDSLGTLPETLVVPAAPDAYSSPINQGLNIAAPGVLSNDPFVDTYVGGARAFLWTQPSWGTVQLNSDGSLAYQANYLSLPLPSPPTDSFEYILYVPYSGVCSPPTAVTITLGAFAEQPLGLAPIGASETYPLDGELDTSDPFAVPSVLTSIPGDQPYTVAAPGVLTNDRDPYTSANAQNPVGNLEAILTEGPVWDSTGQPAGTITGWNGNDGGFTFTPPDTNFGRVRFGYQVCYRFRETVQNTCSETVRSYLEVAPTITVRPDTLYELLPSGQDADSVTDGVVFVSVESAYFPLFANDWKNIPGDGGLAYQRPTNGTFGGTGGTLVFRPDPAVGVGSFEYRRCFELDGVNSCSDSATVEVRLGAPPGGTGVFGALPPTAATGSPFVALYRAPVKGAVREDFRIVRLSDGQVLPVSSISCSLAGVPRLCNLDAYERVEITVSETVVSGEIYAVSMGQAPTSAIVSAGDGSPVVAEQRTVRPVFGPVQAAPTITIPTTPVLATEAVLGEGAPVPFVVTATGVPTPTVTCAAGERAVSSGDRFAAGIHVVDCEAANGVGSPATASFTIEVEPAPKAAQAITFAPIGDVSFAVGSITLEASSDSGLPVAFQAGGDCTVSGNVLTLVRAGLCGVTATQAGSAAFAAADPVTRSFAIASAVQVAPRTGQYSDLVALSATVSGAGPGVVTFGIDGASVCAIPTVDGVATCNAPIMRPAGEYELVAVFVPIPPGGQPGRGTSTITVTPETSTLQYTGSTLVATGGDGTGVLALTASVGQQADGSAGDLTKAPVVFDVFRAANASAVPDWTVPAASVTSAGVATATSPALAVGDYRVAVRQDGSAPRYFAGGGGSATVTVYAATTGGGSSGVGTVIDPSTDNIPVAVAPRNNQGAFAYSVRNARGTNSPRGAFVYSFRGADGNRYVITASSWSGGTAVFTRTTAAFSGKASVSVLDSRGRRVPGLGGSGFTFRVDATDGARDSFALSVWTGGGSVYHRVGTKDNQVPLASGRLLMTT